MMITDATRLRQSRALAEVDLDRLIRSAHFQRNRAMLDRAGAALRAFRRRMQIVPRILPQD